MLEDHKIVTIAQVYIFKRRFACHSGHQCQGSLLSKQEKQANVLAMISRINFDHVAEVSHLK